MRYVYTPEGQRVAEQSEWGDGAKNPAIEQERYALQQSVISEVRKWIAADNLFAQLIDCDLRRAARHLFEFEARHGYAESLNLIQKPASR